MAPNRSVDLALKRLRNWVLFAVVVFVWSLNWSVMKSGLNYVDPLNFAVHRFSLSAVAMIPVLVIRRRQIPRNRWDLALLMCLGVINSLGIVSTNMGLTHEESGMSAVMTYSQPLFVFCMAIPFLEEKADVSRLLGLLVGFLGVTVLALRTLTIDNLTNSVFLLLGAFLWAFSIIFYKKFLTHIEAMVTSFFQMGVGALLLGLVDLVMGAFQWPPSLQYAFVMLYASIAASVVGFTIWLLLLKEEDATVLSSSSLIIPLVSFIFGWFLLGENFEPRSVLGALLILIGVCLVNRNRRS